MFPYSFRAYLTKGILWFGFVVFDLWGELSVFEHSGFWPIRLLFHSLSGCALKVNRTASLLSVRIHHCHSRQDTTDIKDKGSHRDVALLRTLLRRCSILSNQFNFRKVMKLDGLIGMKLGWGMTTLLVVSVSFGVCLVSSLPVCRSPSPVISTSPDPPAPPSFSLSPLLALWCAYKINNF